MPEPTGSSVNGDDFNKDFIPFIKESLTLIKECCAPKLDASVDKWEQVFFVFTKIENLKPPLFPQTLEKHLKLLTAPFEKDESLNILVKAKYAEFVRLAMGALSQLSIQIIQKEWSKDLQASEQVFVQSIDKMVQTINRQLSFSSMRGSFSEKSKPDLMAEKKETLIEKLKAFTAPLIQKKVEADATWERQNKSAIVIQKKTRSHLSSVKQKNHASNLSNISDTAARRIQTVMRRQLSQKENTSTEEALEDALTVEMQALFSSPIPDRNECASPIPSPRTASPRMPSHSTLEGLLMHMKKGAEGLSTKGISFFGFNGIDGRQDKINKLKATIAGFNTNQDQETFNLFIKILTEPRITMFGQDKLGKTASFEAFIRSINDMNDEPAQKAVFLYAVKTALACEMKHDVSNAISEVNKLLDLTSEYQSTAFSA